MGVTLNKNDTRCEGHLLILKPLKKEEKRKAKPGIGTKPEIGTVALLRFKTQVYAGKANHTHLRRPLGPPPSSPAFAAASNAEWLSMAASSCGRADAPWQMRVHVICTKADKRDYKDT